MSANSWWPHALVCRANSAPPQKIALPTGLVNALRLEADSDFLAFAATSSASAAEVNL